MPIYPTLGRTPLSGGLYRKKAEQQAKEQAIPEAKGAVGTMDRNMVEEPIERPVAPGAKKIVGVKPTVDTGRSGRMGMLPGAGEGDEAGPSSLGMMASSIAPKSSSGGQKKSSSSSSNVRPAASQSGGGMRSASVRAAAPSTGPSIQQPLSRFEGGGPIASLEDAGLYGTPEEVSTAKKAKSNVDKAKAKLPSEQAQRAANTTAAGALRSSLQTFVKNPIQEAPKAAKGIAERVKETVTNAVKGSGTYNKDVNPKTSAYDKAVKAYEKAKSVLRSALKGWFA